jgi:hypothetical protein
MRQFKWIEWNLQKIDAHGLAPEDVEAAVFGDIAEPQIFVITAY